MNKIILTVTCIITSILANAQSPSLQWANDLGGIGSSVVNNSIALDNSGNVFTTGRFNGKADFDPGAGTFYMTSVAISDIFITKISASGVFQWAKQIKSTNTSENFIAADGSGNTYITGMFRDTIDFDPGPGTFNLYSLAVTLYVLKLDASGNFVWAKSLGGTVASEFVKAIKTDVFGNVCITGYFASTKDFDPGPSIFNLTSAGSLDVFILKLNSSGNFLLAKRIGGTSAEIAYSITTDASSNIYFTGYFSGTCDFDPGAAVFNLTTIGNSDLFIAKLDASGNFLWAKSCGGVGYAVGSSISIDGNANVLTTGYFLGTVDFDPEAGTTNLVSDGGNDDIFISKLTLSGTLIWARSIGGTQDDWGNSIFADAGGNVYITGFFQGVTDFDPGPGTFFSQSSLLEDIFIEKLDASGNFTFAKFIAGNGKERGNAIAVDASGNIYSSGVFTEIADFDPGAGVYNLYAFGNADESYISKLTNSGNFVWAIGIGVANNTIGRAIGEDSSGNLYVSGDFCGTTDFDPGPGTFNLSSTLDDYQGDVFVAKLNSSGNFLWTKKIGGINGDYATAIAIDASGNVFLTGSYFGTVDFDPGAGVFNLTAGNRDVFILKLDNLGNFLWAKSVGGLTNDNSTTISLDGSGNIYVGGGFSNTADFDPGVGTFNMTSAGINDVFILKLDASGNFIWAKKFGGTNSEAIFSLKADATGNTYSTGYFFLTTDFDPGPNVFNLTSAGSTDIFITKLDASGNFLWAKSIGYSGSDQGNSIDIDASGNVYTTGYFNATTDFDPGPGTFNISSVGGSDIFNLKLNGSGDFVWAKSIGSLSSDLGNSIKLDASGNVFTTGVFNGTADFDPGAGSFPLSATSTSGSDAFVSILNSSGNFVWAGNVGSINSDLGYGITTNGNSFSVTGEYFGSADFDPGAGATNVSANGATDCFVMKMNYCTTPISTIIPTGPTTFCSPGSVILSANTGAGLTYVWKKNGIAISGGTSSNYVATTTGSYTVVVTNTCGTSTSAVVSVTVNTTLPATPGSITTTGGAVKVCPGDIRTYSIAAVSGATSYTWTPCAGSTITSGQNTNSVTILYNANFPTSDSLRVVANNGCGSSAQRKIKISRNTPGTPSAITGINYGVCLISGIPYSVTNVSGMTYAWSFNTGTATIASGQGTSAITANYGAGFLSATMSVTAANACGVSTARLKTIYAKPATPASITGSNSVCLNQQDVPYSIAPLANVSNYTWTGPTGSHVSDGSTTSAGTTLVTIAASVTIDFATTAGTAKVRGNNACASGSYKSLAVAIVCREGDSSPAITEARVFPNPAATDFTIETDDPSVPFDLEIYDALCRLVFSEVNQISSYQVDANGWADGLYSVVVHNGNNKTTLRLVLQELE